MILNIIFFIIILIFLFVIFLTLKALNRGIKAKSEFRFKKKFKKMKPNIVIEIEKLKKLRDNKTLSEIEFKKAKNKLLSDL
ncbi:hypothetical protein OAH88_04390 [Candidatus Pelagibacter sp.]|jgi:hypothetical protein|nr:hypothetical protein [Candidatus Pelagibacter sp.]